MVQTCVRFAIILLCVVCFFNEASSQAKKSKGIIDAIGFASGLNMPLFYPKDVNRFLTNAQNPHLKPSPLFGLNYFHSFSPRWAHIFQFRFSNHQIQYQKSTRQTWSVNGERITVKSDTGIYNLNYDAVSMGYATGWCIEKTTNWHIYVGIKLNYTVINRSLKTVDRIENGKLVGFEYVAFPEPLVFLDETSPTYSADGWGEVLFRTDCKINLGKKCFLRPVFEYGHDTGHTQVNILSQVSLLLEAYHIL